MNDTVHVNLVRAPEWGGIGIPIDGSVVRGQPVPHEAANLQCNAIVGERKDFESGITYTLRCKKRAGHEPSPLQHPDHVPQDVRILASSPVRAHGQRFAPSGIPAGVDQTITLPHDCGNHLKDVEDIANGYR